MIPAESRMREIRTSGSTSGGVETDRMGAGLSTKRKRGQEAPDPTRHRATPRLYFCQPRLSFPTTDPANAGPERIEAWQTVESYKIDHRMNRLRVGEWLREPGNEDKPPEEAEAALGLKKPGQRPAVEAALRIANANATDDLGFLR